MLKRQVPHTPIRDLIRRNTGSILLFCTSLSSCCVDTEGTPDLSLFFLGESRCSSLLLSSISLFNEELCFIIETMVAR